MALTKFNFNSFDLTTAANTGIAFNASANGLTTAEGGALNLITTNTISSAVSSSSFTSGIDSTYDTYLFKLINIQPATNDVRFGLNLSIDGGSNYNVTKTTTMFGARHEEDDSYVEFGYEGGRDLAQSTSDQTMSIFTLKNSNPESLSGSFYLFSPSSTTFVKHFIGVSNASGAGSTSVASNAYFAGYANTTSAINAITFKMDSGNIDSGTIKMYGITK